MAVPFRKVSKTSGRMRRTHYKIEANGTTKCPKCGETIELGKDQYNALLSEIGNEEIEKRLQAQTKQIEAKYKAEFALAVEKEKANKDKNIEVLSKKIEEYESRINDFNKEKEIYELKKSLLFKKILIWEMDCIVPSMSTMRVVSAWW